MSYDMRNGYLLDALFRVQVNRRAEGFAWEEGLSAEPGSSGSTIEVDVDPGGVLLAGSGDSVGSQTVPIPDGDPELDRKDVIYVNQSAEVDHLQGEPSEPATDDDGNELYGFFSPVPAPPSTRNIAGVAIWVINVPAGASDSSDISFEDDFQDRRLGPLGGSGDGPELPEPYDQPNLHIPNASIEDGDHVDTPIHVPAGRTLKIYSWAATEKSSGSAPSGLRVGLASAGSTSMINSENTTLTRGDPIMEEDNTGSSTEVYHLRVENGTGSDYEAEDGDGIGVSATYTIE